MCKLELRDHFEITRISSDASQVQCESNDLTPNVDQVNLRLAPKWVKSQYRSNESIFGTQTSQIRMWIHIWHPSGWIQILIKGFDLHFAAKLDFDPSFGGARGGIRRRVIYEILN